MVKATQIPIAGRSVVLENVSWSAYEKFLDAVENRHVRLTYDRGSLEIVTPLFNHEWWKQRVRALIIAYGTVFRIAIQGAGSTTFRRRRNERGLEPDESFFIRNAEVLRGRRELDLERDPPPDLALEVDITSSSLNRMEIYAVLGVSEVWRLENEVLRFNQLRDGVYVPAPTSLNLPRLTPHLVHEFVEASSQLLDTELHAFAPRWLRRRIGTPPKPSTKQRTRSKSKRRRSPKDRD
jgi:Uma2 family endonuclease